MVILFTTLSTIDLPTLDMLLLYILVKENLKDFIGILKIGYREDKVYPLEIIIRLLNNYNYDYYFLIYLIYKDIIYKIYYNII